MKAMSVKLSRRKATLPRHRAIGLKPGDSLTFQLGDKSEVTLYGHVDVSADYQTNGLKNASGATGNNGWVGDVSEQPSRSRRAWFLASSATT